MFGQFQTQQTEFQPISFQSTSALSHSGSSYSSTPTINNYGTAIYNETSYYSQNKVGPRKESANPSTPGTPDSEGVQQPIGDTPWVLMILLIGFYILRKKWKRMHSLPL